MYLNCTVKKIKFFKNMFVYLVSKQKSHENAQKKVFKIFKCSSFCEELIINNK
uniref:Uncharacterized protein n=1 Tax=Meloidogyne enterolobii TaxID=390850 RepID=A0A6V7XKM9_MELEN|nr:unnamed protein product [Meloidogyne enterolobii]